MKYKSNLFAFGAALLCLSTAAAQESLPSLPAEAANVNKFIPRGWKSDNLVKADLNKDSLEDAAFILHNDQQAMLVILLKKARSYSKSFAGSFSSIEYITKLNKRSNSLEIVFDLPSYSAGHLINIYSRYQDNNWMIIGYSEETHDDNDAAAAKKQPGGLFKDVNLITGDVVEQTIKGTKKIFKRKYKQKTAPLLALKDIDQLPVMNW